MNFFEKLKLLKKNNATEMNYRLCETFSVKVL
jgi:hypothetical protein